MPKIPLALMFDSRKSNYVSDFKWLDLNKDDPQDRTHYIEVEINVSEPVAKAVKLTKQLWERENRKLPLTFMDNTEHGTNRGLVIKSGFCRTIKDTSLYLDEFTESELVTRISFGCSGEKMHQDLSNPFRVHFAIMANRCFFPKDWEKLGLKEGSYLVETANYSLRWINGTFEDWSDPNCWNSHDKSVDQNAFNRKRTIHAASYVETLSRKNSSEPADPEVVLQLVKKTGRKNQSLPVCPKIDQFRPPFNYANKLIKLALNDGVCGVIPIMGAEVYHSLRDKVDFPYTSQEARNSPLEGANFVFGPVLESMSRFVESRFGIDVPKL